MSKIRPGDRKEKFSKQVTHQRFQTVGAPPMNSGKNDFSFPKVMKITVICLMLCMLIKGGWECAVSKILGIWRRALEQNAHV